MTYLEKAEEIRNLKLMIIDAQMLLQQCNITYKSWLKGRDNFYTMLANYETSDLALNFGKALSDCSIINVSDETLKEQEALRQFVESKKYNGNRLKISMR